MSAPRSGSLTKIESPVILQRRDAGDGVVAENDLRHRAAGDEEAAGAQRGRAEDLDALLPARHVGDDERSVRGGIEAARLDDPSLLLADVDDLPRGRAIGIDHVDRVPAAIEDEVIAAGDLLERRPAPRTGRRCAAGSPPTERRTSTRSAACGCAMTREKDGEDASLVRGNRSNGLQHVRGSRKDHFLEHRRVRDGAIERGDARHGRVELSNSSWPMREAMSPPKPAVI